jgi:hypothetical protein
MLHDTFPEQMFVALSQLRSIMPLLPVLFLMQCDVPEVRQKERVAVLSRSEGRGPFWQARCDFNVSNESKLVEKLRYIHRKLAARKKDLLGSTARAGTS